MAPFIRSALKLVAINVAVLAGLLIPIELIFGNWIRPMSLSDLKRFSIPINIGFEFDTSTLYSGGPRNPIRYTRDQWGLRGSYQSLREVDVVTVGGSTTDQRYLDDAATWQAVAQRELQRKGQPLIFANAGVDGQSTVGHVFNFQYWFPLMQDLRPRAVLFYFGINDVLRHQERGDYDGRVDATSWRVRSATYQFIRTVRDNMRARNVRVWHGRMRPLTADDFTEQGLLTPEQRQAVTRQVADNILAKIEVLRANVETIGAAPVFVTQTAYAWNADRATPRGLKETVTVHGYTMNYADVAYLHQGVNRRLLDYCKERGIVCFDLASDVKFDVADYYDYTHNTPRGAEKIGHYLADRLLQVQPILASRRQ